MSPLLSCLSAVLSVACYGLVGVRATTSDFFSPAFLAGHSTLGTTRGSLLDVRSKPTATTWHSRRSILGTADVYMASGDGDAPPTASVADEEFWLKQKALAVSMQAVADKNLKEEQREKFAKRRLALVSETLLFSTLIFGFLWTVSLSPFTPISYAFGAILGTAYSYGLGKYVETLGGTADDTGDIQGAGVGQARFAFLILLFIFVGKFRSQGLQEIPSIAGFFTYQLASLSQGLREYED